MHKLSLGGNEEAGLFGVFDGHGGQEVALFVAKHLVRDALTPHAHSSPARLL
jgi:serine/threonine protein phosphatase PrpC